MLSQDWAERSKFAQEVTVLAFIPGVTGLCFGRATNYADIGFSWSSTAPLRKCRDILN
jgi:hypothetical protein